MAVCQDDTASPDAAWQKTSAAIEEATSSAAPAEDATTADAPPAKTTTKPATVKTTTPKATTPKVRTPKATTPKFATFKSGDKVVGDDIQPGTYRAAKPDAGCYWERLKAFDGKTTSIIANGIATGPVVVTILPSDKWFSSDGCGTWTSDLSQASKSKTEIVDGTWIVGTDITPGTYKATGAADDCYRSRLKSFEGGTSSIITNGLSGGSAVVTIEASDKGFATQDCGTWKTTD
jgi:hypothetical protein